MEIQNVDAIPLVLLLLLVGLGVVGAVFAACRVKSRGPIAAALAIGVAALFLMRFRGGTPQMFILLVIGGSVAAAASLAGIASCCTGRKEKSGGGSGAGWLAAIGFAVLLVVGFPFLLARNTSPPAAHAHAVAIEDREIATRHAEIIHRSQRHGTVSETIVFDGPIANQVQAAARSESESASAARTLVAPPAMSPFHMAWSHAKQAAAEGVERAIAGVETAEEVAAEVQNSLEAIEEHREETGSSERETPEGGLAGDAVPLESEEEDASGDGNSDWNAADGNAASATEDGADREVSDIVMDVREEIGAAIVSFAGFSSAPKRPDWAAEPRSDGAMEYHPQGAVMYVSTPAVPSLARAQSALEGKLRLALKEYADLKLGRGSGAMVVEAAPQSFLFGELVESPEDLYIEANIRHYGEEAAAVYTGFARLRFDEFSLQQMDEFKRTGVVRARVTGVSIMAGAVLAVLGVVYGLLRLDSAAKGYYTAWLTPVGIVAVILVAMFALKAARSVTWGLP